MQRFVVLLLSVAAFELGSVKADDSDISSETDASRLGGKICRAGYIAWPSLEPVEKFEKAVLMHLGLPENTTNKEQKITQFFNENNPKLICGDDTDDYIRQNEHLLKRSLARAEHTYLIHVANHYDGFDWNFFEIVDGQKETILDYLDMIFSDPDLAEDYDIPELKSLVRVIEQDGGKRGRELE